MAWKLKSRFGCRRQVSVSTSEKIWPEEERTLSVLKHIAGTIKPSSRWSAVFQRYLAVMGDRVRGVGGSPGDVAPSPTGEPGATTDDKDPHAIRLSRRVAHTPTVTPAVDGSARTSGHHHELDYILRRGAY